MPNLIMQGSGTKLHSRFMKWPIRISAVLGFVVFINIVIYTGAFLERYDIVSPYKFILSSLGGIFGAFVGLEVMFISRGYMVTSRLWEWGKYRFDTWDELWEFWSSTPADELERMAGQD
jgi:hypothetical protein